MQKQFQRKSVYSVALWFNNKLAVFRVLIFNLVSVKEERALERVHKINLK